MKLVVGKRKLNFVLATADKWHRYEDIIKNSPLYDHYFKGNNHFTEWFKQFLDEGIVIVETEFGEPIGLLIIDWAGMGGEFPYLFLLGVKDGYRGQGIGECLLETFFELCRNRGFKTAFIACSDFNPRAKALYESVGFEDLCFIPDLYIDGVGEYFLMKKL